MSVDSNIIPLFPTGLLQTNFGRNLTQTEFNFLNRDQPIQKNSLSNTASEDSYVLNAVEMKEIKEFCQTGLDEYFKKVICPASPVKPYITQSWLNWTVQGESHQTHFHHNSFLSGVLYLNTTENDGITFLRDREFNNIHISSDTPNHYNTRTYDLSVNQLDLLIFPSSLNHMVKLKEHSGIRVSLAFNSYIRGTISSQDTKSELILM